MFAQRRVCWRHTVKGEVVPLPKHHNMEASRGSGVELHTFLTWAVDDDDE